MSATTGKEFTLTFSCFPEISSWVTIQDQPLEIRDIRPDGNTTTGTIEAVDGKAFKVHWADEREEEPMANYEVALFVDGVDCNGTVTSRDDFLFSTPVSSEERITSYEGKEESHGTIRPFSFKAFGPVTASASSLDDENGEVGTIELRYYRIKDLVQASKEVVSSIPSESAGGSYHTAFDDPIRDGNTGPLLKFRRIDPKSRPLCSIQFRYGSKKTVERESLLSADSSASPVQPLPQTSSSPAFAVSPTADSLMQPMHLDRPSATPNPPPSLRSSPSIGPSKKEVRKLKKAEALLAKKKELEALKEDLREIKKEEEEAEEEDWIRVNRLTGNGEMRVKEEEGEVRNPVPEGTGTGKNGEVEVLEVDV